MPERLRAHWLAYGAAVAALLGGVIARWLFGSVFKQWPFYGTCFPAVMIAAYFGGLWPGLIVMLIATALSNAAADPRFVLQFKGPADTTAMILFVVTGTAICLLSESLHRARRRLVTEERYRAERAEHERAEAALRGSEQRWRSLTEALPQLVWTARPDGSMDYCSTQIGQYMGRPQGELLGWGWLEMLHPDDRERTQQAWRAAVKGQGEYEIEHRFRRFDGTYRWFKTRGVAVGDGAGNVYRWFGTCTDVTADKQLREELAQANERLDLAVRGSNLAIWEFDMPDGRIENSRQTFVNVWESLGYDDPLECPPDFASGFALAVHPDDQERLGLAIQEFLASDRREFEAEYRARGKDGSDRWRLARGVALRDSRGRPVRFIGSFVEITDLKRAEQALRKSEQRFRTFVDHATDAFFLFDDRNVVLDVNRQACQSLGYTRDELLGTTPMDFDPDATAARLEELRRKSEDGQLMAFESRHRRKDGTIFPVEVRGQAFWEGGRRFTVSLARDTTDRKRAEDEIGRLNQELRSRVDEMQAILDIVPVGIAVAHDPGCRRITHNPYMSELLGVPVWKNASLTAPPDEQPDTYRVFRDGKELPPGQLPMQAACAGVEVRDYEIDVVRGDGGTPKLLCHVRPLRDASGRVRGSIGAFLDITSRRRMQEALRQSEEQFRGTFENAGVGIARADMQGRWLRVNEKLCAIVGYTREELLQKTFADITYADDLPASLDLVARLKRGEFVSYSLEKRYVRKDGSAVWVDLTVSLQRDATGAPANTIAIVQDISERKRLEGELRRAKEAAEAANRAKDEFLANVSHEIRTPMNAILGMTEMVLDTPLAGDQRQSLKTVKSAADNLLGIINDLLDFSKIEAGKLELDLAEFSLRSVVGDTVRALAPRAHRKGLELVSSVEPKIPDALIGDSGRIRQVLLNLIGNAIKFTQAGEVVFEVDAAAAETDSDNIEVRFTVRDTGIGIPKHKQSAIFRAFEQEDTSTTRKFGGTGLGLTITAQLAALMGGSITVESEVGRGSTFCFTARFAVQAQQPDVTHLPAVSLRNLRVLVVDDNAANRQIMENWLRGWGMEPASVGDGVAAMDALWHGVAMERPYPLILLDARMPDTDGLTLAGKIRERAELSASRIILLTSGDRPGDAVRLRELSIDGHLLKPVQQDELVETIQTTLSRMSHRHAAPARSDSPARTEQTQPSPVSPLRVLVAEDNEFNRQLMEQLLGKRGHSVRLVDNGREALNLANAAEFDLLLLDVHMPELDGFQVIQAIRERERALTGAHLPVVALTARSRKEDRERCLAAGMDEFLSKPIQAEALWATIDRVVSVFRKRDESRPRLVSPHVLLAACGNDDAILTSICQRFQSALPTQLATIRSMFERRDSKGLRESAHKLCGMVSAFSAAAAGIASDLEDRAARGQLDEAQELVDRIHSVAEELLIAVGNGLTVRSLQRQIPSSK